MSKKIAQLEADKNAAAQKHAEHQAKVQELIDAREKAAISLADGDAKAFDKADTELRRAEAHGRQLDTRARAAEAAHAAACAEAAQEGYRGALFTASDAGILARLEALEPEIIKAREAVLRVGAALVEIANEVSAAKVEAYRAGAALGLTRSEVEGELTQPSIGGATEPRDLSTIVQIVAARFGQTRDTIELSRWATGIAPDASEFDRSMKTGRHLLFAGLVRFLGRKSSPELRAALA